MTNVTPDEDTPPTLEEQYAVAVGSSNLRVRLDRRTVADMVIAAGMNPHRLGMALRRLVTEWDAVGKPAPLNARNIEDMAAKYTRIPGSGLVLVIGQDRDGNEVEEHLIPLVAAKREADRWHAHELGLLFQRLKTLPEVRNALVYEAAAMNLEGPEHVVGAVLQWWLNPICPVCLGVKKKVVQGTGRTGSKDCRECKGEGQRKLPHGYAGRKVLSYMQHCQRQAVADLRKRFSSFAKT